jgi:hypothetical protein
LKPQPSLSFLPSAEAQIFRMLPDPAAAVAFARGGAGGAAAPAALPAPPRPADLGTAWLLLRPDGSPATRVAVDRLALGAALRLAPRDVRLLDPQVSEEFFSPSERRILKRAPSPSSAEEKKTLTFFLLFFATQPPRPQVAASYPSAVLARGAALLLRLEHIQAIVTRGWCLLAVRCLFLLSLVLEKLRREREGERERKTPDPLSQKKKSEKK